MPTQSTTYNSRVTDEALEKRFRDTFRSQGGAELVDDLYAQGVIVPVVDFTAAATGQQLAENLQTAWDFTTGLAIQNGSGITTAISNAGFWKVLIQFEINFAGTGGNSSNIQIFDGSSAANIIRVTDELASPAEVFTILSEQVVFLRAGDSLRINNDASFQTTLTYRQIATVNGDLVQPSGFTSS
jgi:hypothetical protein